MLKRSLPIVVVLSILSAFWTSAPAQPSSSGGVPFDQPTTNKEAAKPYSAKLSPRLGPDSNVDRCCHRKQFFGYRQSI